MRRLLALFVVLAACVGLTAAPASAERVSGRDPRADVATQVGNERPTAVARPSADLVGYAIRYGDHRISVVMRYRDLKPQGRFFLAGLFMTLPDGGGEASLQVVAGRGDRAGRTQTFGEDGRRCATRHRINYRRDVVRVSVPAACFGRPRYLDAFVGSITYDRRNRAFYDIAPGGFRAFVAGEARDEYPTVRVQRG